MKLGLGLPHYSDEAAPDRIVAFAQRAEALGYDSVWALERLLRPVEPRNPPWEGMRPPQYYARVFDPIETVTYVAAHTRTIRLGTSVIDPVSYQGRFYRIPPSEVGPKPLREGGVPVLIGVLPQAEASVERAGRMGLGLHPMAFDWKSLEHQLTLFRETTPSGREPGPVVVRVNNPVTETPLDEADRTPLSGSVEQVRADLQRAAELGIDYVMWDLTAGFVPYDVQLRLLEPLIEAKP
ncbi:MULTISPECIES: LLM class flavin-dependent oxidoreductase [Amycolatopsis]|uniref:Luciferase-like monooxygenase n=2 Tax=Amycolatopsis TaxID=1813 RepID=A0A1I3VZZ2_9PSEU|nr:LLM class flavin-dependent oxidoreductase [Amycolatopsis sacchari]SFK00730.1 Luciferase-like monooxygenase [Amycolatopsis sacchari]